jgi:ferredoxin
VNDSLDKAILRTGMELTTPENVVLAMDRKAMDDLSLEAFPATRRGMAHGPQKEVHYPQKSLAVLTGLAQFGVSRFVFRDEIRGGKVKRFLGPIRSLVIFDREPLVLNGYHGVIYPHQPWRDFLFSLSDFTKTEEEINVCRFCTYIPVKNRGCEKCISACPPEALIHSVPDQTGRYTESLHESKRFWKEQLQFDYERCRGDRKRMATLFPEWRCGRCITVCSVSGRRMQKAVEEYEKKKRTLAAQ